MYYHNYFIYIKLNLFRISQKISAQKFLYLIFQNLYPFREWLDMNLLHLTDLKNPNKKIPVHIHKEKGLTRITQNTVILGILELLIH